MKINWKTVGIVGLIIGGIATLVSGVADKKNHELLIKEAVADEIKKLSAPK